MKHQSYLFQLSWQKFLALVFALLSVAFLSSGVIIWLAANWDYFTHWHKLYGTQALLALVIGGSCFAYWWESLRYSSEKFKFITASLLFFAAMVTGALFALLGQTYQTGANAWQLFAIWSLFQLPLLFLLPNIASAILLIATLNITLFFLTKQLGFSDSGNVLLVVLNVILLLLSECFSTRLRDKNWRDLPKITHILMNASLFFYGLTNYSSWNFLLLSLISLAIIRFYYSYRLDIVIIAISFVSFIGYSSILIVVISGFSIELLLFLSIYIFILCFWGMVWLKRYVFSLKPELKFNWVIQLALFLVLVLSSGLLSVYMLALSGESKITTLIFIMCLLILAIFLHFHGAHSYVIDVLFANVGILFFSHIFIFMIGDADELWIPILLFVSYMLIINYLRSTQWLRSLVFLLVFWSVVYSLVDIVGYSGRYVYAMQFSEIGLIGLLLWLSVSKQTKYHQYVLPIIWGFAFNVLYINIINSIEMIYQFEQADELPTVNSIIDIFNIIIGDAFQNMMKMTLIESVLYWITLLSPLFLLIFLSRKFSIDSGRQWIAIVALTVILVAFIGHNTISFSIALIFLSFLITSRLLFVFAILFSLVNFMAYYYWLSVPLLYEGFLLLFLGGLLVLFSLGINRQNKTMANQHILKSQAVSYNKMTIAGLFLIVVLGVTNQRIFKYEDVLANGKPIILEITPVDPRSLMQGDYMELNYAIFTLRSEWKQVKSTLDKIEPQKINKAYGLVQLDERNVAQLCRVEVKLPIDYQGCSENLYLPLNIGNGFLPRLPSQSYFFPEGKGKYYAQAKYTEYRFKEGVLLLFRLLDQDFKPL
ncbi:GDYXXLXY domain-containing protein [Rodentibacter caecimuris]|uniref:DUF4401 domain-containing protein n=1 Tax=Rodentibacter caecimuris TaxID=1796644 RepID=A0ABX3L040_9PAST|nr:hypothetical protein BKG89_03090 [Rodentibacter heylii]